MKCRWTAASAIRAAAARREMVSRRSMLDGPHHPWCCADEPSQLLQHVLCTACVRMSSYFDRASGDNTGRKDQPRSFMPPIRINLVHGTGVDPAKCHKCVVDTVVVVEPEHAAIAKVALNKLRRLKSKSLERVQLALGGGPEHPAGSTSQ